MVKKNSCVFISGTGSNLKALIQSSRRYNFPINIKLIVSNKKNALGLNFAKKYAIPFKIINTEKNLFEVELINEMNRKKISLICLAGYMKILSKNFINSYKGKIINIHPSLLPKYKGTNTFSRILADREKRAGCTVHFVNEKLDSGRIILKKSFEIVGDENVRTLRNKTQRKEYTAFSEAITKLYMSY
tara:strand:- start:243 stop:806 length:564 start_codon:yes stop_codon:yes gene_type:complete